MFLKVIQQSEYGKTNKYLILLWNVIEISYFIYLKPNSFRRNVLHKTEHFITNKDNVLLNKSMYSIKNFLKWDTIVDLLQFNGSVLICTLIKCKVK